MSQQPQLPDVSIILVSWNTRDLLLACLASLPDAIGSLHADIWVIDNASSDDSVTEVQTRYPDVKLITNAQNVGFAAANNQAIAASTGRYVLLLNSDTVAHPNVIQQLVRRADAQSRLGCAGPMLLNPDGSFQASFYDFPSLRSEWLNVSGLGRRIYGRWYPSYPPQQSQHPRYVDWLPGACLLVRRATIEQVGSMDERYFMYNEETDWCLRMRRAGWEIWYEPAARIIHYGGQSTRQVRHEMVRALYRSKVRFFRKHYGSIPAAILQASFVCVLACKWFILTLLASRRRDISAGPLIGWRDLQSPAP